MSHELRISGEIPCEEGIVLAVEILTDKSQYNTLELTSGRMAKVARGNVVVGALGHRKALFGYSGHLPEKLAPGDVIQMLNIGGVLGVCDSVNPDKGRPFDCRVLGTVLHFPYLGERIGVPARVGMRTLDYDAALDDERRAQSSRSPAPAWKRARRRPPAPSSRACAIAASSSTASRRRAFRSAATSSRSRMRAAGAR